MLENTEAMQMHETWVFKKITSLKFCQIPRNPICDLKVWSKESNAQC